MADNKVTTHEALEDMGYASTGDITPTENFYLSKEGVTFYYNVYDITPYSMGPVKVTIPFALALFFRLFGAALGCKLLPDGVFFLIDLAVVLRQEIILHGAEHGLRDPVDGDRGRHGEADPEADPCR